MGFVSRDGCRTGRNHQDEKEISTWKEDEVQELLVVMRTDAGVDGLWTLRPGRRISVSNRVDILQSACLKTALLMSSGRRQFLSGHSTSLWSSLGSA